MDRSLTSLKRSPTHSPKKQSPLKKLNNDGLKLSVKLDSPLGSSRGPRGSARSSPSHSPSRIPLQHLDSNSASNSPNIVEKTTPVKRLKFPSAVPTTPASGTSDVLDTSVDSPFGSPGTRGRNRSSGWRSRLQRSKAAKLKFAIFADAPQSATPLEVSKEQLAEVSTTESTNGIENIDPSGRPVPDFTPRQLSQPLSDLSIEQYTGFVTLFDSNQHSSEPVQLRHSMTFENAYNSQLNVFNSLLARLRASSEATPLPSYVTPPRAARGVPVAVPESPSRKMKPESCIPHSRSVNSLSGKHRKLLAERKLKSFSVDGIQNFL